VELTVCLGLMTIVLGLSAIVLDSGSDTSSFGYARGSLASGCQRALTALEADVRETAASTVETCTFTEAGFAGAQSAVALGSPRDSQGQFHLDSSYGPRWQAVVVYCPYVLASGVRELRRYVVFDSECRFPVRFDGEPPVTAGQIELCDSGAPPRKFTVDRANGNLAAEPSYQVFCPGLTRFAVETGSPLRISLAAQCVARKGAVLEACYERSVGPRN
jgi:hypothetical protein